jgi:predicted transposase YbfD/YdcC
MVLVDTAFGSVEFIHGVRKRKYHVIAGIARYFISSLEENAERFANYVRSHWGIENSLHWILDVALREDDCRIRKDNAPQNFAVLRQMAVNLLSKEKRVKRGIKNKQFLAAMDNNYLTQVLALA